MFRQRSSLVSPGYFKYKNMYYTNDTMVIFTEKFMKEKRIKPEYKYGRFTYGSQSTGSSHFLTYKKNLNGKYISGYDNNVNFVDIPLRDLESAIESIVMEESYPCVVGLSPRKRGYEVPGVWGLWGIYLVLMFLSMIFKDFTVIWTVLTVAFIVIRYMMISNAD